MSGRAVVERYTEALSKNDTHAMQELAHPDYICRYPQSGEVIRGPANLAAIGENYPGQESGRLGSSISEIRGRDDEFVAPPIPAWNMVHLTGSGDEFTVTTTVTYPNGETWHGVLLITVRDGKIWREIDYFAAPFEAPEWRAPFVERE